MLIGHIKKNKDQRLAAMQHRKTNQLTGETKITVFNFAFFGNLYKFKKRLKWEVVCIYQAHGSIIYHSPITMSPSVVRKMLYKSKITVFAS